MKIFFQWSWIFYDCNQEKWWKSRIKSASFLLIRVVKNWLFTKVFREIQYLILLNKFVWPKYRISWRYRNDTTHSLGLGLGYDDPFSPHSVLPSSSSFLPGPPKSACTRKKHFLSGFAPFSWGLPLYSTTVTYYLFRWANTCYRLAPPIP